MDNLLSLCSQKCFEKREKVEFKVFSLMAGFIFIYKINIFSNKENDEYIFLLIVYFIFCLYKNISNIYHMINLSLIINNNSNFLT